MNSSLKYLGLGGLARQNEKNTQAAAEEGKAGEEDPAPSRFNWTAVRRKSGAVADDKADDEDDSNIRFTIGGVGKRMNKEDFIKEVQKLDANTRNNVAEQSNASRPIKEVAKRNPGFVQPADSRPGVPRIVETRAESNERPKKRSDESGSRGRPVVKETRTSPTPPLPTAQKDDDVDETETPVERRRRLAVLASQSRNEESANRQGDSGETPAERRRREAALGMAEDDSDSEDEGGERVPPARRGIRFAEPSRR